MSSSTLPNTQSVAASNGPRRTRRFSRADGWSTAICKPSSATFCPGPDALPTPEIQMVEVSPAHGSQISSQVLCECHWQPLPQRRTSLTAIILHGLEGSSHSQYVTGNANKLWRSGCNVIRMNMRNCGPVKYGDMLRLSPTLYHSGLSSDVERVLRFFLETAGPGVGCADRLLNGWQSGAQARRRSW